MGRLIKAIVYETSVFVLVTLISWLILNSLVTSIKLTLIVTLFKIVYYYYYEKLWEKLSSK